MFTSALAVFVVMFHCSALVYIYFNLVCPGLFDHKTRLLLCLNRIYFLRIMQVFKIHLMQV